MAGTTAYTYYIVARNANGATVPSPAGTTATGNAVLSATNYNALSWAAVLNAVSYDVLKGTTATLLANVTTTSLNDTGQATGAYTPNTANTTGGNLTVSGSSLFKPTTDSTTAFQIQNAASTSLLTVDTTNLKITLGSASATPTILVLGVKNDNATDPTCTPGAIYYNSTAAAFRGCQDIPSGFTNLGNPAGTIVAFAGSSAPTGYLIANGSAISRTTYANLFAIIGTTYGVGDGSTTFNLPDLRGRTAVGLNSLNTDVSTLGNNEGAVIGSRTPKHKHTVVQPTISQPSVNVSDPGHSHTYTAIYTGANTRPAITNPPPGGDGTANTGSSTTGITAALSGAPTASGGTVGTQTNAPTDSAAYLTVNYIIKY